MTLGSSIFSAAELDFIKVRAGTMTNPRLHIAFVERFDRTDVTAAQIKNCCKARGWRSGLPMKRFFSEPELAFIKKRAGTMKNNDLHRAFVEHFGRHDITARQIIGCCACRGWPQGLPRTGRPRGGAWSKSFLHQGSLKVAVEGAGKYQQMQRVVWEEIVGPLPKGVFLLPINGDRFDFDPLNWIMLTNRMMSSLRQSPFFTAPPELRQTILAAVKLKQTLQDRTGVKLKIRRGRVERNGRIKNDVRP